MSILNHLINKLDYFIFESFQIKTEYLGLYRILYCLLTFLFYGIPNFTWIDDDLNYMFFPPQVSIANLFSGVPDRLIFTSLNVIIVILYFMLLFGWHTKRVSILLFLSLLFCYSFSYSFGKIDHTILWLIIPLIMAFSGWGNAFSLDAAQNRKSEENAWAISLMALLLGFAMFTASVPKIMGGWLSLNSLATKSHLIFNHFYWQRSPLLLDEALKIKSDFFWEIQDYLTIIFEFGFLIAIINPLAFRVFVIAAVIFHISVFLTFDITFVTNLLTYLLFINWAIFNPLIKSDSFKILVNKVFKLKYLAIIVSCILIYGIVAVAFNFNFIFPSLTGFLLKSLPAATIRDFNTLLLFTIALVITILSVVTYFKKQAKADFYQVKVNS